MSFTVVKYPNEPIIIQTFNEDYDMQAEIALSNRTTSEALDNSPEDGVYLIDVFNFQITFEEIVKGANIVARGERPLWHHPKLKQVVLVTADGLLRMAAEGMAASVFGGLKIPVFETLEEALAYARANS
jgi:hypothetical protein